MLPELDPRLSRTADTVCASAASTSARSTAVAEATAEGVRLSDGEFVPTRSLIWCVGVRPDPLVDALGLPTEKGRLVVDEFLRVPGHPEVFACGDAAAVPDLTRPGEFTAMTAQHAQRQGKRAAAERRRFLRARHAHAYKHHDLGFVVDLGGFDAAANPLGVPLSGVAGQGGDPRLPPAAIPGNRLRLATDWLLDSVLRRQVVQLGLVRSGSVPLDSSRPNRTTR